MATSKSSSNPQLLASSMLQSIGEEGDQAAPSVADAMSNPFRKRPSRLRRIFSSSFTKSKSSQDQSGTILRHPLPATYRQSARIGQNPQPASQYPQPHANLSPSERTPSPSSSGRSGSTNAKTLDRPRGHENPNLQQGVPRAWSSGDSQSSSGDSQLSTYLFGRPQSSSLAPPLHGGVWQDRSLSSPKGQVDTPSSGPPSPYMGDESPGGKSPKRMSWFSGRSKSRNASQDLNSGVLTAWIYGPAGKLDYALRMLVNGENVPELWDNTDNADVIVHLFPPNSGRGPSFKVPSHILAASESLVKNMGGRPRARSFDERNPGMEDALRNMDIQGQSPPPIPLDEDPVDNVYSPDGGSEDGRATIMHLHFPVEIPPDFSPLNPQHVQTLVDARNLFAFLTGQPLVGTPLCPTQFRILLQISSLLWKFDFRNSDGSTCGEAVSESFSFFANTFQLADVRRSNERVIEGLILGELMRSAELYEEAFAHAVGRYKDVRAVNPDLFNQIKISTLQKLERAGLDLKQRKRSVRDRLTNFDFPSLFAGVGSSNMREEAKFANFRSWRSNFMAMRRMVLNYYRSRHGQWPPKTGSKKHSFVEGGLNRLVLKGLYVDFCGLYDLLADREHLTTRRTVDATELVDPVDETSVALRILLEEYDRSSPPVQPAVPFDLPRIPNMGYIDATYATMSKQAQQKSSSRKMKDHELGLILAKSHNLDTITSTPFIAAFLDFEAKESRGKTCQELAEQRYGHWIFLYAVIQSLPMLVIDAPGVRYAEGVEYFLCAPPLGGLPWLSDAGGAQKKEVYRVGDSDKLVRLPSDLVNYGIYATYRRSHCWMAAAKWLQGDVDALPTSESDEVPLSPLAPPPRFADGDSYDLRSSSRPLNRSRDSSPAPSPQSQSPSGPSRSQEQRDRSRQAKRNSIAVGLSPLPIPSNAMAGGANLTPKSASSGVRWSDGGNSAGAQGPGPGHKRESSFTFDEILKNMGSEDENEKTQSGRKARHK